MPRFLVVLVTSPGRAHARRLARALLRARLAACVNVLDADSLFWWKGKLDEAHEALLIIKTSARHFERLRKLVCALHPYEVPEVIALPIQKAHQPYLRWVTSSLQAS